MFLSPQFMEDVWVRRSFSSAGHTLLVYDFCLTFSDEIWYIWNAPWTVVKVMFLINRYGNLAGQTFIRLEEAGLLAHNSQEFCQHFALSTSYFMILSSESIHILVLMRAWAIWGTRTGVSKILVGSYVSYVLILLGAATYGASHSPDAKFHYLDLIQICVGAMPKYVWTCYVGSFVLDIGVFVLTMQSLRRYSRDFECLYPSKLLHLLVRDAIVFFVISMFNDAMILSSWTAYSHNPKYFLAKGFSCPLLSVAGQRLVLNLRGLKTRTYSTHDLSLEVDRQLEGFAESYYLSSLDLDNVGDPEADREP
ncbi:uncharacterized protein EDB91DRAFT_546988 [Suillus paluster]|uniref:uncharacterized protein n=1 Tax=Suillus paluster TaxID=48578 RepID=UPI001B87AE5F|nr:uncharacterized protein EDB91DRAFT_546988 [Suillus paluster]KAG1735944.1 hypothetical protein EDB91DRAFT_546988 [Suillus paluster]